MSLIRSQYYILQIQIHLLVYADFISNKILIKSIVRKWVEWFRNMSRVISSVSTTFNRHKNQKFKQINFANLS